MQSNAHTQKHSHTCLFKYIPPLLVLEANDPKRLEKEKQLLPKYVQILKYMHYHLRKHGKRLMSLFLQKKKKNVSVSI